MTESPVNRVERPRILILIKHYEPAFRFGGPIRSIANLVEALQKDFEFKIVCLNRDFRETDPLGGINEGVWLKRRNAEVCYLDVGLLKPFKLIKVIRATDCAAIYLNSFFDPLFSTLPALLMKFGLLKRRPIVISPRGEFSPGALALKSFKKMIFMRIQSLIGLYADACWHAATELEAANIRDALGDKVCIRIAPDLPPRSFPKPKKRAEKAVGKLRLTFLSRISPMKNLLALLLAAKQLRGTVHLNIWGPVDDATYWRQCQKAMAFLPPNINATYCGVLPHESVASILEDAEVLALPTLGENYGYVIYEALSAGCPVVISDRTPWRNLAEAKVGFDVPLDRLDYLVHSIQQFVDMDENEYGSYAETCRSFAVRHSPTDSDIESNRHMFTQMLGVNT